MHATADEETILARAAQLVRSGALADAAGLLRAAVDAQPDSARAALSLCGVYQALAQPHAAFDVVANALAHRPDDADLHYAMAGVLRDVGDDAQAILACEAALERRPGWADAYNRIGVLHERTDDRLAALYAYANAAAAAPAWHVPWHNQANVFTAQGRRIDAERALRESLARAPAFKESHDALADLLLTDDRYEEGWPHYEWRFGRDTPPPYPGTAVPVWNGERLDGEIVMVWIEQGLGDHLQFARCVRTIRERGGRAWLQVPAPLFELYRSLDGVDRLVGHDETVAGYDRQIPLLSLARIAAAPHGPELASVPYLHAPPLDPAVRAIVDANGDGAFKVGVVWASLPSHPAASRRDCDLGTLLRLADVPRVRLYALQFGEQRRDLAAHAHAGVVDLGPVLGDFAQTAAIVEAMDLVVTVDTAMAHLAGALGTPTWLLLGEPADWRWQRMRDDTPWYPSLRLFRQHEPGRWDDVIDRVAAELARRAA